MEAPHPYRAPAVGRQAVKDPRPAFEIDASEWPVLVLLLISSLACVLGTLRGGASLGAESSLALLTLVAALVVVGRRLSRSVLCRRR